MFQYTHIVHLADIHIRNGNKQHSKYDQYMQSFQNLDTSIRKKLSKLNALNTSIIVVAGDIFHNKYKVENFGLKLLQTFLSILTNIAPTVIIPGNHDFQQQYPDEPSLLDASIFPNIENLYYMTNTSTLELHNIGISTLSVKDTLIQGESFGISSELPTFPSKFSDNVQIKVALFHGTFGKVMINDSQHADIQTSYPLDMLNEFDIATLGDIHLVQHGVHNKCKYAYSGSLIQQNYGENIIDHGYIIWDIDTKIPKLKKVYNDVGYVILQYKDSIWNIKYKNSLVPLSQLITHKYFPKTPFIRIDGDFHNIDSLLETLQNHNIDSSSIHYQYYSSSSNSNSKNNLSSQDYNVSDISLWIDFMKKHNIDNNIIDVVQSWLINPDKLLIPDFKYITSLKNTIDKRNNSIQKCIQDYKISIDSQQNNNKKTFSIVDITFEYTLCYGPNNYINFLKCQQSTLLINGPNASGKSSLYEIICYAIFGEPMKSRESKKYSSQFINVNKPPKSIAFTKIQLQIKEQNVTIYREYHFRNNNVSSVHMKHIELRLHNDNSIIKGSKAVIQWIHQHIGTLDDFLKISMVTQDIDQNILKLSPKEVKDYIDDNINLDVIHSFQQLISETLNSFKYIHEFVVALHLQHAADSVSLESYDEHNICCIETQLSQLLEHKNTIRSQLDTELVIDYHKYPVKILESDIYTQLEEYSYISSQDIESIKTQKILYENKLQNLDVQYLSSQYNSTILSQYNQLQHTKPKSPSCTKEFVTELYNDIKDYIHIDYSDDYNSSDDVISRINVIEQALQKHQDKKPNTSITNVTSQFNSVKDIKQHIISIFNSIDNCYNITVSHPKYNGKINNSIDCNANLVQYIEQIDSLPSLHKIISECDDELSLYSEQIDALHAKINNIYSLLSKLDTCSKPNISLDIANEHINKSNTLSQIYPTKFEEYSLLKNIVHEFKSTNERIELLENQLQLFDDINYNPNCDVCMQQQSVQKKLQIIDDINKCKNILDDDKFKSVCLFDSLQKWIDDYNSHIIQDNTMRDCISQHNKFQHYTTLKSNYDSELSLLTTQNNTIKDTIHDIRTRKNNTKHIVDYIHLTINTAHTLYEQYSLLNFKRWQKKFDDYNSELVELQEILTYFQHIQPKIKMYKKLKKEHKLFDSFQNITNIFDSYQLIHIINPQISQYDTYFYLKDALNIVDLHKQRQTLITQLHTIEEEYTSLHVKYNCIVQSLEQQQNKKLVLQQIEQSQTYIEQQLHILQTIKDCSHKYQEWLYTNHIIPNIIHMANQIISHTTTSKFKLYCHVENDSIEWFIQNQTNNNIKVSINKASGFQKFVCSIVLRIVIPKLQSNYNKCNQLFLDEGWTSADANNRTCVPHFLSCLLKEFHTVVLVSHIDEIRDSIDTKIDIKKNSNQFSHIVFT